MPEEMGVTAPGYCTSGGVDATRPGGSGILWW